MKGNEGGVLGRAHNLGRRIEIKISRHYNEVDIRTSTFVSASVWHRKAKSDEESVILFCIMEKDSEGAWEAQFKVPSAIKKLLRVL